MYSHGNDRVQYAESSISPRASGQANLWTSDATLPSGGLVVYGVGPPKEWGFEKYNSESKNSQIQD